MLFPLIRETLWAPDGKPPPAWDEKREGSVLKRLLVHRSLSQIEVAILGLRQLRDEGHIDWLKPGAKVTSRALYSTRSGVSQMFELATQAYWRTAKRPNKRAPQIIGDILFSALQHSNKYRTYLRSPEWRARRERALILAARRCAECHQIGGRLDVHHMRYDHLGAEPDEDLEVLCRTCHDQRHAKRPNPWEVFKP